MFETNGVFSVQFEMLLLVFFAFFIFTNSNAISKPIDIRSTNLQGEAFQIENDSSPVFSQNWEKIDGERFCSVLLYVKQVSSRFVNLLRVNVNVWGFVC